MLSLHIKMTGTKFLVCYHVNDWFIMTLIMMQTWMIKMEFSVGLDWDKVVKVKQEANESVCIFTLPETSDNGV